MSVAPPPGPRTSLHLRRITCEGFLRDDGLIEIEGLLIDTKPDGLKLVNKTVGPGEPIHQMRVRLTIDKARCIVDVAAYSEHIPYPDCVEVEAGYRKLIGMRIEPGFTREIKRLFRGTLGCSHMTELLPPMASTALQVLWADGDFDTDVADDGAGAGGSKRRSGSTPIGGCHALRPEGEIVRTYFSQARKESAP